MHLPRVYVQANAKINLTLDVLGKRQDGYHNIRSVMQSISLNDRISLTKTPGNISVHCGNPKVPCNSDNLVCRAALALKEATGVTSGVHIELRKGIPVAAGLGGGSADAAAVLRGLNVLWNTGLNDNELRQIGKNIGADVPFCLMGGTALAEGIGEILTPLKPLPRMYLVLFKPEFGVSTADVYRAHDRTQASLAHEVPKESTPAVLSGIDNGDLEAVIAGIGNMLQNTTTVLYPEVQKIIDRLVDRGVKKALMCGSGPTVCAIVSDQEAAKKLKAECSGFSGKIYIGHTVLNGNFLLELRKRGEKVGRKKAYTYTIGKL